MSLTDPRHVSTSPLSPPHSRTWVRGKLHTAPRFYLQPVLFLTLIILPCPKHIFVAHSDSSTISVEQVMAPKAKDSWPVSFPSPRIKPKS